MAGPLTIVYGFAKSDRRQDEYDEQIEAIIGVGFVSPGAVGGKAREPYPGRARLREGQEGPRTARLRAQLACSIDHSTWSATNRANGSMS